MLPRCAPHLERYRPPLQMRYMRPSLKSSRRATSQLQVSRCAANTRHRGVKGRRTALTPRAFNGESRVERRSCRVAPRYRALQPPRPRGCRIAKMREYARVKSI